MITMWKRALMVATASRGFTYLVLLPTIVVAAYFFLIASDVYVSETHFTVRSQAGSNSSAMVTGLLAGIGDTSPSSQDVAIVSDFIQSKDILERLEATLQLRAHYSDSSVDLWGRLRPQTSAEDFLDYYRGKIEVFVDESSGIVALKAKAYSQEMARKLAQEILKESELLVNTMSLQMSADSISFAQRELERAEKKLLDTTAKLSAYRDLTDIVDPSKKSGAVLGIITALESSLAEARTQFNQMRSFLRDDSAEIVTLKERIRALEEQIAKENRRLTGGEQEKLSAIMDDYERLYFEKELANQFYTSALTSLEAARAEANHQRLYLITFVRPALPDSAVEPEKLWEILTVFLVLLLMYVVAGLIVATVKDHIGVG